MVDCYEFHKTVLAMLHIGVVRRILLYAVEHASQVPADRVQRFRDQEGCMAYLHGLLARRCAALVKNEVVDAAMPDVNVYCLSEEDEKAVDSITRGPADDVSSIMVTLIDAASEALEAHRITPTADTAKRRDATLREASDYHANHLDGVLPLHTYALSTSI